MWKLYFASLAGHVIDDWEFESDYGDELLEKLEEAGLRKGESSLKALLSNVVRYVKHIFGSVEVEVGQDPNTGFVVYSGRITFDEPPPCAQSR